MKEKNRSRSMELELIDWFKSGNVNRTDQLRLKQKIQERLIR